MLTTEMTKDTVLCISLAARPSNLGTRFHNFLYGELGLDFVYKAFTTTDIAAAVCGVRALGIRGCAISMPFKEDVIPLLDSMDASASAIDSVNTIVNTDGRLRGYNTDYTAVRTLLADLTADRAARVVVLGSGGMAKAVVAALRDSGFGDVTVVARNERRGPALAAQYGFAWRPDTAGTTPDLIVNATPVGMAGGPEAAHVPIHAAAVDAARFVMDVVAVPAETPLIKRARAAGATVLVGTAVAALQAADQFALYTGIRPSAEQVARAAVFSRSG